MARTVGTLDERAGTEGSWAHEARRVAALAGELGVTLDEERILLFDVRELVTLRLRLQDALNRPRTRTRPWTGILARLARS